MSGILAKIAALKNAQTAAVPKAVPAAEAITAQPAPAESTPAKPEQTSTPATSLPQIKSIVQQADAGDDLLKDVIATARGVVNTADVLEVAHAEVKDTLSKISEMLGNNHPLLPNAISKVHRIIKQHEALTWELSMEDVGLISRGMQEASKVVLAEKATKSRGKKGPITEDDLL